MRVVLRLQRSRAKRTKAFKVVAQPYYKNLRGKYLDHVGWRYPVELKGIPRSVIVNKMRARYWMAVGAGYSKRVQSMLSLMGIAQEPWLSFGTKTLYKDP